MRNSWSIKKFLLACLRFINRLIRIHYKIIVKYNMSVKIYVHYFKFQIYRYQTYSSSRGLNDSTMSSALALYAMDPG